MSFYSKRVSRVESLRNFLLYGNAGGKTSHILQQQQQQQQLLSQGPHPPLPIHPVPLAQLQVMRQSVIWDSGESGLDAVEGNMLYLSKTDYSICRVQCIPMERPRQRSCPMKISY